MANAQHSTGAVAQALQGIDFPADKRKLVDYARRNNTDRDVMQVIERMPDEHYASMADVFKGVGRAEG
ncbi:MAG: DUF2795 domain-containing protein [Pseudomonadota bacterium]